MSLLALKSAILLAALSLPASRSDDGPVERRSRLAMVADALGDEAQTAEEAFAVLALWEAESRLDWRVHAGVAHPVWTSDRGAATCLGQVQASGIVPTREWRLLAGISPEATHRCARATMRVLRAQRRRCTLRGDSSYAAAFTAYGTGGTCAPAEWALSREYQARELMARFWGIG